MARDALAGRSPGGGGRCPDRHPAAAHARPAHGRSPVRLSLVSGSCALLVSHPLPGRQPPRCAFRCGAGDDELVVRPQCARLFLYSAGAGGDLLLLAESDRTAAPILQPVTAGILDASVLLRDGRCTPSDRRTSSFLADHAL